MDSDQPKNEIKDESDNEAQEKSENNSDNEEGNEIEDKVEQIGDKVDQKLLIERHRHICDDQKLVDSSQNFSDFKKLMMEQIKNNSEKNKS